MKQTILLFLSMMMPAAASLAQNSPIDFSGNNTSSSYKSYDAPITVAAGSSQDVKMARYSYFNSKITGAGTLNLYAGGERSYLGTEKGAAWPDWSQFTGPIHIYPFKENATGAGFWGVVLAHGGKKFSPESVEGATVNNSMDNNAVTLHSGATICTEANSAGSGFRIGELQTEAGSTLMGYMKKDRAAYYLLGCLNTDATLAGTIKPSANPDNTLIGILKEGTGTYRITANDNYLSGALRVLAGRVLVNNQAAEAQSKKLSGALGARPNENEAIAYVFEKAVLGGTGSIGGLVDNYGIIEPGDGTTGTLTLQNYVATSKNANLQLHPASVLRFKIAAASQHDSLHVAGNVLFNEMKQDFTTATESPVVQLVADDLSQLQEGDELTLLTAKGKTGDWKFTLRQPAKGTWEIFESERDDTYKLVARLASLNDAGQGTEGNNDPANPDAPTMGAFYNDGIDDAADNTTLRDYARQCGKQIGAAFSTYKGLEGDRAEGGRQFNLLVAENEMKMDALQPNRGEFTFWGADQLVDFAAQNNMAVRGHCLVWHQQQPGWVSSDGKKNDKNWSRAEALAIMKDHITQVMTHFKGKIMEWDVVNECLDDDQSIIRSNPDKYTLRQSVWQRAIGDDYIDSAFVYAHRVDPSVALYLNDYDVELQGRAKSVAYYNLAVRLKNAGIPIEGVGLQCHFSLGKVDSVKLDATIRRFGEAGLKCIITELDMGMDAFTKATLEEQARNYRVITDIVLNNENCPNMVIWGIKDNDSWRSAVHPLLYTSALVKKPAYYGIRSALRHRALHPETSVPFVRSTGSSEAAPVFDLNGRQVQEPHLHPGIYIRGGKKMVIR